MSFRSYLFVPADSPRKMARALQSGADALILDLEDSVAADRKEAAREEVARFLRAPAPMARFVRVNALGTGLTEADVAATATATPHAGAAGPDGYVLPKCEGPDDIATLSGFIDRAGGGASVRIMAIATETVRAVRRLMRENWSHPRLSALTWGGEDLSADMGAARNRDAGGTYLGPFQLARNLTLLAALEAGVEAVDAVYTDFANTEGLRGETAEARDLGFAGKLAIHPAQVAPIHDVFRPDPAQVAWARQVVAALEAAGGGVARLDGEMLDRPHLRQAKRILARLS